MHTDSGLKTRKVQLIIDQIDSLPTLPVVATRVLALAASDDSSASDLTRLIEADQSLTSRVLALVNSAVFSRGKPVTSVGRAVTLLGFEAIRSSVLSVKVFELFNRKTAPWHSSFDRKGFWKHCLAVAGASQMIARRVRGVNPEEAFVAGLLHDIGKVALDHALPKTFDQVVKRVQTHGVSFVEAEARVLGTDHAAVGRRLARNWHFPESLVNVIWLHHQQGRHLDGTVEGQRMLEVVQLADMAARRLRIGASGPPAPPQAMAEIIQRLGLGEDFLESVSKDLHRVVAGHVQAIGLDTADESDLFYESLQNANSELGRINTRLMMVQRKLGRETRRAEAQAVLAGAAHGCRTTQDVLQAVAGGFLTWAESPVCVVYSVDAEGQQVEGVLAGHARGHVDQFLFEMDRSAASSATGSGPSSEQYGVTRAEQTEGWLFERLGERLGDGPFYSCPFRSGEKRVGAVVLSWPEDRTPPVQADVRDLSALATTAALALNSWRESLRAERVAESLAQAGRRMVEAQEELVKRRNLASVGAMAAGAAHEINNPLAVISGRAQLLAEAEPDEKKRKSMEIISEQAERASGIINELMSFARPPVPMRRPTDLGPIVGKVVEHRLEEAVAKGVELTAEVGTNLPAASIDGGQVEWALDELVGNALAATEPGGRITVGLRGEAGGDLVTLDVTDTGAGMDEGTLARACDPFFSGRRAGRGRGLGLAKVQRVAESNGASLQLESIAGQGTTARLVFDLAAADASGSPPSPSLD